MSCGFLDAALAHRVERLLDVLRRRLAEEADAVDGEEGEEEARDDLVEAEERELLPDEHRDAADDDVRFQNRLMRIAGPKAAPKPAQAYETISRMKLFGLKPRNTARLAITSTLAREIQTSSDCSASLWMSVR